MKKFILLLLCVVIVATSLLCFGCTSTTNEKLIDVDVQLINNDYSTYVISLELTNISEIPIKIEDIIMTYTYEDKQVTSPLRQTSGQLISINSKATITIPVLARTNYKLRFWLYNDIIAICNVNVDNYITE